MYVFIICLSIPKSKHMCFNEIHIQILFCNFSTVVLRAALVQLGIR